MAAILCALALGLASGCSTPADDEEPPVADSSPSDTGPDISGRYETHIPERAFVDPYPFTKGGSYGGAWLLNIESDGSYGLVWKEQGPFSYGDITLLPEGRVEFFEVPAPAPEGTFNCYLPNGKRTLTTGKGIYKFRLTADALILSKVREFCEIRDVILDRKWTRV